MNSAQFLDPTALRAFAFAADFLNFTKAAAAAGLTQSGISQHISKLESQLGSPLFLRIGRKVQLTDAGTRLRQYVERQADQTNDLFESFQNERKIFRGKVRYAMPDSCLMTPHFKMLLEKRRAFDQIDLQVFICDSETVIQMIQSDEIDFGFVTQANPQSGITFEQFSMEDYVLVGPEGGKCYATKELLQLDFVKYPGLNSLLSRWQDSNFPRSRKLNVSELRVRGEITSLSGAIDMVLGQVGVSIFPLHCVATYIASKKLKVMTCDSHTKTSRYPIFIAQLSQKVQPARVQKVLESFRQMTQN